MKTCIVAFILFLFSFTPLLSQSRIDYEYFDSLYQRISKDSAYGYYRIEFEDSGSRKARRTAFTMDSVLLSVEEFSDYKEKVLNGWVRYYYAAGGLSSETFYIDDSREGQKKKFFENGQLKLLAEYSDNELDGLVKMYAPNGRLIREEKFVNDRSKGGECYTSDGLDTAYTPFHQIAVFPGGDVAFVQWVNEHFQYPKKMRNKNESGSGIYRFVVNKQGFLENFSVVESSNPLIDQEAFRILALSPQWLPAYYEGVPVKAWRQIPIQLNLE